MEQKLFLFRAKPEGINREAEFLENNIIAIGWKELPSLKGKSKDDIKKSLEDKEYTSSNVTVGQINHFVNNMDVGSLCLIPSPSSNDVHLVKITSNYFYNTKDETFPHQRKIQIINTFNRYDFPSELNKALKPAMTIADISHRLDDLNAFINGDTSKEIHVCIEDELKKLLPIAIENIKECLESEDLYKRTDASLQLIRLLKEIEDK